MGWMCGRMDCRPLLMESAAPHTKGCVTFEDSAISFSLGAVGDSLIRLRILYCEVVLDNSALSFTV